MIPTYILAQSCLPNKTRSSCIPVVDCGAIFWQRRHD